MAFRRFLFASLPETAPGQLHQLFKLWRDVRAADGARRGEAPAASRFRGALGPFEEHVGVARYAPEEEDVFVMSAGAELRGLLGVDLARRWMSEACDAAALTRATAPYRAAARLGRPTFGLDKTSDGRAIARLILPVSAAGADPTFIMAVYPSKAREGRPNPSDRRAARGPIRQQPSFVALTVDVVYVDERQREVARVLRRVQSARMKSSSAAF